MSDSWALAIARDGSLTAQVVPLALPELAPGQARLRIDRFAMTANNVTYATFGDAMRYWDFFPADDGTGRVPVWGFASVTESRCDGLAEGARVYGFLPAASHLTVTPADAAAHGFTDAAPHRAELSPVYNSYQIDRIPVPPEDEARRAAFEPLTRTAALLTGQIRMEGAEGAQVLTITGASSKTALSIAAMLRDDPVPGVTVEGLTSARSRDFVAATGLYDRVADYGGLALLPAEPTRLIVDVAGSAEVNRALHARFGARLAGNIRLGAANWADSAPARDLPGPKPRFFFAPDALRALRALMPVPEMMDWLTRAETAARAALAAHVAFEHRQGATGAASAWADLVAGRVPPDRVLILRA